MCFRPSAVAGPSGPGGAGKECPACGLPLNSESGIEPTTCPHCGTPIPQDGAPGQVIDDKNNKRIL